MEGSRSALSLRGAPSSVERSWRTKCFMWLLHDWQPRLSVNALMLVLVNSGILCLALGIAALVASDSVVEVIQRYDDNVACSTNGACTVPITIPDDMAAPVYFYYRLTKYGQNSRRYVKSRSDSQLQGQELTTDDEIDECDPRSSTSDDKVQYPCGLIAYTFFNDEFNITLQNGDTLSGENWSAGDIAWPSDVNKKFVARSVQSSESRTIERDGETLTLPSLDDQGLMVWMRPAALPDFRKLYRIIHGTSFTKSQVINVNIDNNFVSSQDGQKFVVLSTASWLGGKSSFIGIVYVVGAALLFITALGIFLVNKFVPA